MPISAESDAEKGLKLVQFQETPRIPSYLFAFAIGNFLITTNEVTNGFGDKLPIRVIIPKGYYADNRVKSLSQLIIDSTISSITTLEKYFESPLWAQKMDMIAVPHMLIAGMENLGLCFLHVIPHRY